MRRLLTLAAVSLALAACGSHAATSAADDSGIRGRVLRGPLCPVATQENPCPDEPYATDVRVVSASGKIVATVRSGSDGRFVVHLDPGHYVLMTEQGSPLDVIVGAHSFAQAVVEYDTGIR
jgi:hypothetical protein